ncbi:MAG: diaminopimelate decarboxylase [Candidatus Marinimicrobia bacterium CG08_land_8_20_14_0_20_45_22]|nr:MAG: diaminopimelate decarboxylase [Candidatus Marinimicrobia bacterium CG08_land_8_20_14_0_20_45_22]
MKIGGMSVREIADKYGTPVYVYDFAKIEENAAKLLQSFHSDDVPTKIFYAMKANSHPAIVKLISENGLGVDCVSPGELEVAMKVGIQPSDILYTGNYESYEDLAAAFHSGAQINLDDANSLDRLLKIGKPERISFRINPGKGRGKFEKITTGGERAKFGIPHEKAALAYKKASDAGIQRFGAHIMTGSGVLDDEHFPKILELFLDILGKIHRELDITFEFIDMGGGLGIPYQSDEKELDISYIGKKCIDIFRKKVNEYKLGNPVLTLEPGRYLVGNAGFLVSSVLGLKESYQNFIGIDAGFQTLIRTALYGAYHTIIVDGKENETEVFPINVCGQICENTDIFARDRMLPKVQEGDLLVFTQAGAYGNVMSMPYNHRLRPAEVALIDGVDMEITRRENMNDFWNRIKIPVVR